MTDEALEKLAIRELVENWILWRDAGKGVDRECLMALERWQENSQLPSRVEAQMTEIDRLLAEA